MEKIFKTISKLKFKIKKMFNKRLIFVAVSILSILVLIGGSFYFGYQKGRNNPKTILVSGISNINEGKPQSVDFGLFWQAWQVLKDKYVDANKFNNQDLVYGAISGLVNSLKDPYTVFLPPADSQKFNEEISGQFDGIGTEIGIKNNQLVVVAPLKNTPAERAGLRAGDAILKIDGTSTADLTVDEAVKLIRGPKDTTVTLTIFREGWDNPKPFPIMRDVIMVPTLDWEMKPDNIAYIHLYNFYDTAPYLFYRAAVDIAYKNPKGIILDLRNNPGGYLEAAINLSGLFLDRGKVVVREEFANGSVQEYKASGSGIFKNLPMVILLNGGSASASEIMAGAIHDNRRVKIIGEKSFGKGTVQQLINLNSDSQIKITIAHWLTPGGLQINKNGLKPDYEVKLTDDDFKNKKDPQLNKALEVIKTMF